MDNADSAPASPLEVFVRDYLETTGGAWDEVEPQVYDVLLPAEAPSAPGTSVLRLTFDPEALPEHPGSQLASYGTPLIDGLLTDALRRGRSAHFYLIGLNLNPHNLPARVSKALTLVPPLELRLERVRALHFTQVIYWFRTEFTSDQQEQMILPVAMDLHYGREVRHLEEFLDPSRLAREPVQALPDARRMSIEAGFVLAREQALRTLSAQANVRARQLTEHRDRQIERMTRYYADLRAELQDQASRWRNPEEAATRLAERRTAIDREEQLRVAELMQKSNLRVVLRLLQLLRIDQAKLLIHATIGAGKQFFPLELVWDPLTEALEPPPCPHCSRPTFTLELSRQGLVCPNCPTKPTARAERR